MLIVASVAGWILLLVIAWWLCRAAARADATPSVASSADPLLDELGQRSVRLRRR